METRTIRAIPRRLASELTPIELRMRAEQYRQMAEGMATGTEDDRRLFLQFAERYERMINDKPEWY